MMTAAVQDKDETIAKRNGEFLSFSRINRYLHCPEQYRLYYIENLRLRTPKANLVFGQIIHQSLAALFQQKADPVSHFQKQWNDLKGASLSYGGKESWEKFNASGQGLLNKFLKDELSRIGQVRGAEKVFELNITGLDLPLIGVIDLIADIDGKGTVADFKTAASAYEDFESALSDQLTAYTLAQPEAEQTALWVLVKTKEPKIEWYPSVRNGRHLTEFLWKAGYVAREIKAGNFYKRPGKWCSWCDFLPVCLGREEKAKETLVKVR